MPAKDCVVVEVGTEAYVHVLRTQSLTIDKAIYEFENNLDGVLYIKENASLSNMKPFVKALKKDREKGAPVCLAAALLISEDAYKQYKKLGIPDEVFYDTFSDISVWVNTAKREENIDGLLEVWWIRHILYLNMFKLGRMQYQFYKTDYILSGLSPFQALKAPIKNKSRVLNIHIPEGAVPKDGPSAGITMATAMLSAIIKKPVRADVAMTGEITLRGRVLPIGGLKEKILAAKNAGIKTVCIPKKNEKDVDEIAAEIKKGLEFVFVEQIEDVLNVALVK